MANRGTLYALTDDDIERFKAATQNVNAFTDHYLRTPTSGTLYAAGDDWAPVFDAWRQNGADLSFPVAVHGADWRPITPNPKNQAAPEFELVSNPEITLAPDNKWLDRFIA